MTNEMIERVARAICESDSPDNNWNDKSMSEYTKNAWRFYAKAAIEAMRDYYDDECSKFEACDVPLNNIPSLNQIIDAALKEE